MLGTAGLILRFRSLACKVSDIAIVGGAHWYIVLTQGYLKQEHISFTADG